MLLVRFFNRIGRLRPIALNLRPTSERLLSQHVVGKCDAVCRLLPLAYLSLRQAVIDGNQWWRQGRVAEGFPEIDLDGAA